MDEDVTTQLCKTVPPEVYPKCLSNFRLKGEYIASRYDERMSRLKCDNYVKVDCNKNGERPWNNRNCNSESTPNKGDNSSNTQRDTSQNWNTNQRLGDRTSLDCTYQSCGLRGHKEEDC